MANDVMMVSDDLSVPKGPAQGHRLAPVIELETLEPILGFERYVSGINT